MISCPIILLQIMCASSGITSNSNETGLSCDNAESITDGMVAYPIVLNLSLTDVKVLWCVAGRMSSLRVLAVFKATSPFPVQQLSIRVLMTTGLPLASLASTTVTGCLQHFLEASLEFASTVNILFRDKFDAVLYEHKAETSPESTLELLERELWLEKSELSGTKISATSRLPKTPKRFQGSYQHSVTTYVLDTSRRWF